jgi:hypothetical protein
MGVADTALRPSSSAELLLGPYVALRTPARGPYHHAPHADGEHASRGGREPGRRRAHHREVRCRAGGTACPQQLEGTAHWLGGVSSPLAWAIPPWTHSSRGSRMAVKGDWRTALGRGSGAVPGSPGPHGHPHPGHAAGEDGGVAGGETRHGVSHRGGSVTQVGMGGRPPARRHPTEIPRLRPPEEGRTPVSPGGEGG